MGTPASASRITVRERRSASGLDADVPVILSDGAVYDAGLDRFLLDLPLHGVRSRHSLRAYAYDIAVWLRFLGEARGATVWAAGREDVLAYHRARRRDDAAFRISARSWNRAVAALDKLYRWGEEQGLIAAAPFARRVVWRRAAGGGRGCITSTNTAYERGAGRADIRHLSLEAFRIFRDVGLRGLDPDGLERPGARDRNGVRNALFAELLLVTGLRLEEASRLMAFEVLDLDATGAEARQRWLRLPGPLTKGGCGRSVLIPDRLLAPIATYAAVERRRAAAAFAARGGWRAIDRPIMATAPTAAGRLTLVGGGGVAVETLTPDERGRVVLCDAAGAPMEPAALWLTEVGQPVKPNSWDAIFARASRRCAAAGHPMQVHPHRLRHSFAVHMLAMLIERRLHEATAPAGAMEGYRRLLGDPLQQVQRLLGHASLTTTYHYLDHVATQADTLDTAVDELMARLPATWPR